jgi:hypothetical protein
MSDDGKFAFKQPEVSRRSLLTGGASTVVRAAAPRAAADPLIAEAEHIGQSHFFLAGGGEGMSAGDEALLRKTMRNHPTLSKYADHAVNAYKKAAEIHNKHHEHISKAIVGDTSYWKMMMSDDGKFAFNPRLENCLRKNMKWCPQIFA